MTAAHYRHTQIGWLTLVALGLSAGLVGLLLVTTRLWAALGSMLIVFLVVTALFSALTVEVDQHQLRFRLGPGLIRKRIDLANVRHFATVRNPLWYGWGIHLTPRGVLYNVSGRDAVELHLKDGKCLRVGSDEPEALCRALEQVLGPCAPFSDLEVAQARRQGRRTTLIVWLSVLALVAAVVAPIFYFHEQPPKVTLTVSSIRISGAFYSEEYALSEITHLSLETRLPRIRMRTNGYAAWGTLRGHFRLDELGDGLLFVECGHPPYILIRRGSAYLALNFTDPAETTALYRRLEPLWQAVRAGRRPESGP